MEITEFPIPNISFYPPRTYVLKYTLFLPHLLLLKCAKVASGLNSITKATCADQGYWLGNVDGQRFTIVDTPGRHPNILNPSTALTGF